MQELDGNNPPNPTAELLTGLDIDEYFTRTDTSGAMAFLRDALGSTIGLVNSAGAIATSYTYEPFGNTTVSGATPTPTSSPAAKTTAPGSTTTARGTTARCSRGSSRRTLSTSAALT